LRPPPIATADVRVEAMSAAEVVFYILGGLAVGSSVLVISSRNPVASLLLLVMSFFCLAGIFATLQAHFLAAIQILVYAGAILVLFLFVIMLLNLGGGEIWVELPRGSALFLAALGGTGFVFLLSFVFRNAVPAGGELPGGAVGTTEQIGAAMFRDFLLPFEVTSLLLLVAMVGAVMLAKRER
jgi:NADH-quinone oxidoreductase subunit J